MNSPLHKAMKNYGRFGDTEVRNIDGEPAHVNKTEAHWIDKYGPLGALATKEAGSGTTNPHTGMKEYFPWAPVIGAGINLIGSMFGGKPKMESVPNTDISGMTEEWKANLDRRNELAEQLIDPNSQYNIDMRSRQEDRAYDQMAFQNMMGERNMAKGGMGGYSGIQAQQQTANMDKASQQAQNMIQQALAQNFQQGVGQLGGVGTGYQQYGQMMAQNELEQVNQRNQLAAASGQPLSQCLMGLGQGILNWGLDSLAPNPSTIVNVG